jgi:VWFA-related protein
MTAAWKSAVFLTAGLCLPLAAQEPQFSDTTEVNAVEIPVQVIADGKPVRGLTAADFAVYRGKQRQEVTGFDMVDLLTLPGEKAEEVPAAARRYFLVLFDLSFSEPKSVLQAREAAKDLLGELHPADMVAVATYAASTGSELVLGFTPDREQARAAIDTLGLPELVDRSGDPLKIVADTMTADIRARQTLEQEGGGKVTNENGGAATQRRAEAQAEMRAALSGRVLDRLEALTREADLANQEVQKDRITALARSFTDLARLMRTVQGRKYVVYLSEGYDSSLLVGSSDRSDQGKMQEAAEKGEVWEVNADKRYGDTGAANDIEAMLQELRRADCMVQSVDIGGLRAGGSAYEQKGGRDSLFQLARDTGGDLYENFNDLSAAMGKMLDRTGVTYVLTIQPEMQPDGAYHPLRVELKGGPRGARVNHRPGYYAPRPFAQRSRFEKMILTAGQVLVGEEGGQVQTSVLAVPLPRSLADPESTADVPVIIAIDGPSLLHLHEGNDLPTEIYVYAMDDKGQVRDHFAQTLSLDLPKVDTRLLQAGLKFYGHLELPPGSYKARVLVRNGRTGSHGMRVVPIEVPESRQAGPSEPILLPPFFPESKGQWLVTRETQRPGRRDVPLPFRLGDQAFLPAATPILGGGESRFALLGYNLADEGELRVRSQVLTADGRELQAGDLSLVSRATGEAGTDRLELSFRPPTLQPGEYLLRVTVTDAAGKAGTATTRFVVAAEGPGERS